LVALTTFDASSIIGTSVKTPGSGASASLERSWHGFVATADADADAKNSRPIPYLAHGKVLLTL
jgi:hypothetical protein